MNEDKPSAQGADQNTIPNASEAHGQEIKQEAPKLEAAGPADARRHTPVEPAKPLMQPEPPLVAANLHIDPEPAPAHPDVEVLPDREAERRIRGMSRRGFLWGAAAVAGVWGGLEWLGTRRPDQGIPWPLRRVLDVNENLSQDLFSGARLAPEFPKSLADVPRPNGDYGVATEEEPDWKLSLVGLADMSAAEMPDSSETDAPAEDPPADKKGGTTDKKSPPADKKVPAADKKSGDEQDSADDGQASDGGSASSDEADSEDAAPMDQEPAVMVTLDQIRALPKTEIVTELKCIEGWSTIVHWAGVRLSDFMQKYPPPTKSGRPFDLKHPEDLPEFVSMETPGGDYFVGLDMASALHPQTLLCYEMNGKPLTPEHGAPLRLAIPVKYGIKNIKHIGKIKFTDERPRDYWAELGYDWYAGH